MPEVRLVFGLIAQHRNTWNRVSDRCNTAKIHIYCTNPYWLRENPWENIKQKLGQASKMSHHAKHPHTDSTDSTKKSLNGMLLVAPFACWPVGLLTHWLKKIGVNGILMDLIGVKLIPSLVVGGWCGSSRICGGDSGAVVGCFIYLIPSTQSVNYERGCVLLLRFRLMMA